MDAKLSNIFFFCSVITIEEEREKKKQYTHLLKMKLNFTKSSPTAASMSGLFRSSARGRNETN